MLLSNGNDSLALAADKRAQGEWYKAVIANKVKQSRRVMQNGLLR